MMKESRIYAKEQQIKLIDNILCNLCSLELNTDGRKYIKKLKTRIADDLTKLKRQQEEPSKDRKSEVSYKGSLKYPNPFRISW